MDLNTVFSKTPKASRAPLPWVGGLSAQLKHVLSFVDGKQNVEAILRQVEKLNKNELQKILLKLEEDGYIKRISNQAAEPAWLNDVSSYSINANNNYSIAVEEIDAAELDFDGSDFSADTAAKIKETVQEEQNPEVEGAVDTDVERRAQEVKAIKAKREAERQAQAEAAEKARLEAAEQAMRIAEAAAKARQEVERIEREKAAKAQAEAEEQARVEAEHKAQAELAAKAKLVAEEQARLQAERIEREKAEASAKAKAEEQARLEAERIEREKAEAIAKAKAEEEARLKAEAEEQARVEAERKAQAEAAEKARLEAERIAREEAEEQARIERERKAQEELAAKAKQEAEEQARLEAERIEREKAEAIAKAKAEEEARLQTEIERKAKAEADELACVEAERQVQIEAAEQKLREAERLAREQQKAQREAEETAQAEAEKAAREEAKRLAKEEKAAKAILKAEEKARARELRGPNMLNRLSAKPFKKLLKPLLIAISLVAILVVGLIHVVNLSMLIEPIEKFASDRVGEPVKVQEVHASLFSQPHLKLTGVTVGSAADVKIGAVNMVSDLSMLFKDVKVLKSIEVSAVTLTPADFWRQAQWVNNAAKSDKLKIEHISLKQIYFKVSDLEPEAFNGKVTLAASGELGNVELVNASGNLTLLLTPQNGSCAVKLTASDWQPSAFKQLALDEVTATGVISQNHASFSQIEAKAFGGIIKAQGELDWAERLSTSGNFELVKITLPRILSAFDSSASVEGTLNATAAFASNANQASALVKAAEVNANFEVLNGKVNGINLSHALMAGPASKPAADAEFTRFDTLTGNMQFKDDQYKYKQFVLKTEKFRARGNFNIEPDNTVSGKVSAELVSASQRRQASFAISGATADVKLK